MKMIAATVAISAVISATAYAGAVKTPGTPDFSFSGIGETRELPAPRLPEPKSAPVRSLETGDAPIMNGQFYLLANCSKKLVHAAPKTKAEYDKFYARFSAILINAGMKITSAKFDPSLSVIAYDSPDGLVLRRFIGADLKYDATSDAVIAAESAAVKAALEKNGLPVFASYTAKSDYLRHTFIHYYLTRYSERPEAETRIRLLATRGDAIDYEVLRGVNIIRRDRPNLAVYIGPEIALDADGGADEAQAGLKLRERTALLEKEGKKVIGSRVLPAAPESSYKFIYHLAYYR
jgi:hypothetical protein